jgi:hypothetical protein
MNLGLLIFLDGSAPEKQPFIGWKSRLELGFSWLSGLTLRSSCLYHPPDLPLRVSQDRGEAGCAAKKHGTAIYFWERKLGNSPHRHL